MWAYFFSSQFINVLCNRLNLFGAIQALRTAYGGEVGGGVCHIGQTTSRIHDYIAVFDSAESVNVMSWLIHHLEDVHYYNNHLTNVATLRCVGPTLG